MGERVKRAPDNPHVPHECERNDSVEAIILYPSLGMPMVLGPDQKKCSLIIATGADAKSLFGVEEKEREALSAYEYVDRHLRLTPIDEPKHLHITNTTEGELCNDGYSYCTAQQAIKVWHLGTWNDGMLLANRHSKVEKGNERKEYPFATLANFLVKKKDMPYYGMIDLWEVEIDLNLAKLKEKISNKEFLNWAWLVKTDKRKKHRKEFQAGNYFIQNGDHHEPQDRMIDAYLRKLSATGEKDARYRHFDPVRLFESSLEGTSENYPMPWGEKSSGGGYATRLQSWHPVIRATTLPLKIGHLSDIHINVRQSALSRSEARILEGKIEGEQPSKVLTQPVGERVCHTFFAVKKLMEEMVTKKNGVDTAFLLTGDYIDFNRNIDPDKVGLQIGAQWKQFNVLAEADKADSDLYQRGFDDVLMYSLVREAYKKHKLPVFMVNGNHEGYRMPYGISPRTGLNPVPGFRAWMSKLKDLEREKQAKEAEIEVCEQDKQIIALRKGIAELDSKLEQHRKDYDGASEWQNKRANEGIPADHNLTIYEAALAYGPTYGQNWHVYNFNAEQFDWFHTLFTPFANATLFLGAEPEKNGADARQILALLGWGGGEKFLETGNVVGKATTDLGADQRGPGFLPYATQSLSPDQIALLARAQSRKNTDSHFIVASHFTVFNYEAGKAFYKHFDAGKAVQEQEHGGFCPKNEPEEWGVGTYKELSAQYNKFNFGSCERRLATYLTGYVLPRDKISRQNPCVDWHFSGHSHRAGVYAMQWEKEYVRCEGWDPGLRHGLATAGKGLGVTYPGTQFVVSSSAGSIGIQNLGEGFSGWLLRPPSGTIVDVKSRSIMQVLTKREEYNELPRLCVMLDYLHIMSGESFSDFTKPLKFESPDRYNGGALRFDAPVTITVSSPVHTLGCLKMEELYVWVFKHEGIGKNKKPFGSWKKIKPDVRANTGEKGRYTLRFTGQAGKELAEALGHQAGNKESCRAVAAFCVIPLDVPKQGMKDGKPVEAAWAKDLMKLDDWLFPIELGVTRYNNGRGDIGDSLSFDRPTGGKGEVPDWKFLVDYFEDKGYIPAEDAIDPYKESQRKSSGSAKVSSRSSKS